MARTHTCSNCGRAAEWSDEWMWYGSYNELDDGKPVVKACSEDCRKALFRRGATHTHSPQKPISKRKAQQLDEQRRRKLAQDAAEVREARRRLRASW